MNNIYSCNFQDHFLNKLADWIEENYIKTGKDLSRLAVVFGGKRPALFLKRELGRRIKTSYFPPVFFAIDEFVDYALRKGGDFSKSIELDVCYRLYHWAQEKTPGILKGKATFARFLPWAREILGFLDQLDLEDVSAGQLRNIQLHAEIGYAIPKDINTLLEHILVLRETYHEELLKEHLFTRGLRYWLLARSIPDIQLFEFDQILFEIFFYLHKTEMAVMKNLYERHQAVFIFQGDEKEWPILKDVGENLHQPISPAAETKGEDFHLELYAGFDIHSQVEQKVSCGHKDAEPGHARGRPEAVFALVQGNVGVDLRKREYGCAQKDDRQNVVTAEEFERPLQLGRLTG